MSGFDDALALILDLEGGGKITDDPADPGGLTRWGISQRAYPDLDIRNLSRDEAAAIYRRDYWQPMGCDGYPYVTALMLFDCAVNQGLPTAARLAQAAAGVAVDGIIGPRSRAAIAAAHPVAFTAQIAVARLDRYRHAGGANRFFRGWAARVVRVYRGCVVAGAAAGV